MARVTFSALPEDPLFEGAAAPYLTDRMEIVPMPVAQGVPSVVRARLANQNDFPIVVDAALAIAQRGLGLTFGPLGSADGVVVAANSEQTIDIAWTPPAGGHYCIRFEYTARPQSQGRSSGFKANGSWSGSQQQNLDARPAGLSSDGEKDALTKAQQMTGNLDNGLNIAQVILDGWGGVAGYVGGFIPNWMFGQILDFNFNTWRSASDALAGGTGGGSSAPGRHGGGGGSNRSPSTRNPPTLPDFDSSIWADLPPRAQKALALVVAAAEVTADLDAAVESHIRYDAATQADSAYWAAQHAASLNQFKRRAGAGFITFADALDAYLTELQAGGVREITVTVEAAQAYLDRLETTGFDPVEVQAAQTVGYTAADLEVYRQERLTLTAASMAGPRLAALLQAVTVYRQVGQVLSGSDNFGGSAPFSFGVSGAAGGLLAAETGSALVRVHETTSTFKIGNPKAQQELITLRVRPVDMPPDWTVTVEPATVTLAPGAQADGKLTIRPGVAVPQGTSFRVAVEGYVGSELIGGVATDVEAPWYAQLAEGCDATAAKPGGAACVCDLECSGEPRAQVCAGVVGGSATPQCRALCDLAGSAGSSGAAGSGFAACGAAETCLAAANMPEVGVCVASTTGPDEPGTGSDSSDERGDKDSDGCSCGQTDPSLAGLALAMWALITVARRRQRRRFAPSAPLA